MKKVFFPLFVLFVFVATAQNQISLQADKGTEIINKNIYGHFAEHLGHCIYGGL